MDIKFNILMIEDDSHFARETKENLEDNITSLNLIPNIISKSSYSNDKIKDIGAKFDLLLVDYNLQNDEVGTTLISKVRNFSMLPDIIFYSSLSSIEEIITREEKEKRVSLINLLQKGIYFSKSEDLDRIANDVIKKIINREVKINGFKGMVLSYVSEYEEIVNNIIIESLKKMSDHTFLQSYISEKILGNISEKARKNKESYDLNEDTQKTITILDSHNRDIDHAKRFRIMNKILEENNFETISYEEYKCNVLDLRNSLSHIQTINDDIENIHYVFRINNRVQTLTSDYCSDIRHLLSSYKKRLLEISSRIEKISIQNI